MDTPENHTEQVQVENLRSSSDEDKTKTGNVAIGTDGTNEQQLDVMPAADTFLELSPEVRGGGNASVSTNFLPSTVSHRRCFGSPKLQTVMLRNS